jgi:hypothetical protein
VVGAPEGAAVVKDCVTGKPVDGLLLLGELEEGSVVGTLEDGPRVLGERVSGNDVEGEALVGLLVEGAWVLGESVDGMEVTGAAYCHNIYSEITDA